MGTTFRKTYHTPDLPFPEWLEADITKSLGSGTIESIKKKGNAEFNNCYNSVAEMVVRKGGKIAVGWKFEKIGKRFLIAVHHAVWERPSGAGLQCIIRTLPDSSGQGSLVFMRQGTMVNYDRDAEPRHPTIHFSYDRTFNLEPYRSLERQFYDLLSDAKEAEIRGDGAKIFQFQQQAVAVRARLSMLTTDLGSLD